MNVKREPSRDTAALLRMLENVELDDSPSSAAAVNRLAAERMFSSVRIAREQLSARFTGGTTATHELAVRPATRTLLALQEAISAIGAALMDKATQFGQISNSIRSATEMHLSPVVAPGSVIFTLNRKPGDETLTIAGRERPLLDESFSELLGLLTLLGPLNNDVSAVPEQLRRLGPRAAKHLFELGNVLVDEDLGLDLNWHDSEGDERKANVTPAGARYLREIAKNGVTTRKDVTLEGLLQTVSVEDKQKLLLDSGEKILLSADIELQGALSRAYNRRVTVAALEILSINLSTGTERRTYQMKSVSLASG